MDDRNVIHWNDSSVKVLDKNISALNFKKLNELARSESCNVNELIMSSKSYQKIITRENDDVDTIKRIIKSKKPEMLILESGKDSALCNQLKMNQKTYWIAQNLALDDWKIDKIKNYKGKLLKVILSPK